MYTKPHKTLLNNNKNSHFNFFSRVFIFPILSPPNLLLVYNVLHSLNSFVLDSLFPQYQRLSYCQMANYAS